MSTNNNELSPARRFEIYRLTALCNRYMVSGNYFEALDRLKRLHQYQPGDINVLMMLTACLFALQSYDEYFETAKAIRGELLKKPSPEIRDIILEAEECKEAGGARNTTLLLWCACCAYFTNGAPAVSIDGVLECMDKLTDISWVVMSEGEEVLENVTQGYYVSYYSTLLLMLEDTEQQIRGMSGVDENRLTKVLMRCLSNKADCLVNLKRTTEAMELSKKSVGEMERQFGSYAEKLVVFGEFLCSIGICHLRAENIEESIKYFKKTMLAADQSQPTTAGERIRRENLISSSQKVLNDIQDAVKPQGALGRIFGRFRK